MFPVLTLPKVLAALLSPPLAPPHTAVPSLQALKQQAADVAAFYRLSQVQRALAQSPGRYEHLRHVGTELPSWLLTEAAPAFHDCETQFMPEDAEVRAAVAARPGLNPIRAQRLALATLIDAERTETVWEEGRAREFLQRLLAEPVVISFNGLRFDNHVLGAYAACEDEERRLFLRTLDLMDWLQWRRGHDKPRALAQHAWELLRKRKLTHPELLAGAASAPALYRRGRPEDRLALRIYNWRDTELLVDLWEATQVPFPERRRFYAWWLEQQRARLERELSRALAATEPVSISPAALEAPHAC